MKPLPPLAEINRLLVVKTSSIGDVIHALPVGEALKAARPGLALGWVVRRRCADVLRGCPYIDHLYVVENKPSFGELLRLRGELRAANYQIALDMQGLFLSGLIARMSGAPVRVGWDRNREGNALFLTHPMVSGRASQVGIRHEVDLLYGFAEALGVHASHAEFAPQPYLAEEGRAWAETRLAELPRPRIALNVGASRAYKRWPADRWAVVADGLAAQGLGLVFVGDRSDAEIVKAVKGQMQAKDCLDLSGQTNLRELAAVLDACDLLASADTGPMHIAVAVGTPVVAIFGATDPRRHGPYGARNVVLHKPVPNAIVPGKRPTEEAGAACLAAVMPEDALAAIGARLAKSKLYA